MKNTCHGNELTSAQDSAKFAPVSNPRERRLLMALLHRALSREALDRTVGASNSPDHVMRLRRRHGLALPCKKVSGIDRDGEVIRFGVYQTTSEDKHRIRGMLRVADGQQGQITPELAALLALVAVPAAGTVASLLRAAGWM